MKKIFLVFCLLTLLTGCGNNLPSEPAENTENTENNLEQPIDPVSNTETERPEPSSVSDIDASSDQVTNNLDITSIDETWDLYTNNEYGFAIKVPKAISFSYGACEFITDSYRPKDAIVPVKIITDKNVYLTNEYFYEITGETVKNDISYFSGCDKIANSIAYIKDENKSFYQTNWELVIRDINNDVELESFIKERYGNGCKLGNKNTSNQSGVFDISIKGDDKDPIESECFINYATVLKYFPAQNKVISWNTGQACSFYADTNYGKCYDQEMVDSFKFTE